MAKQSGLHQIKGKVGEFSYYKQTGVSGGLIRGINQGLSARVKSDAAYANTRLNNQEFGAAANTSALLGKMVVPKFRPMILPFSQGKMAKDILKLARQNVSPWGQRTVQGSQTAQIAETLSAQSKRDFNEFAVINVVYTSDDDFDVVIEISAEQATLLSTLGVSNVHFSAIAYDLATGNYNAIAGEMATGYLNKVDAIETDGEIIAGTAKSLSETLTVPAFIPSAGHSGHQLVVVVIMPERTLDSKNYILQELCSFGCIELPSRS